MEEGNGSHGSRKLSIMLTCKVLISWVTLAYMFGLEEEHITRNVLFLICCLCQARPTISAFPSNLSLYKTMTTRVVEALGVEPYHIHTHHRDSQLIVCGACVAECTVGSHFCETISTKQNTSHACRHTRTPPPFYNICMFL